MMSLRHLLSAGFALSLAGALSAQPAMAQYYVERGYQSRPDEGPRYERRRGDERRDDFDRRDGYRRDDYRRGAHERGYERRDDYRPDSRRSNPMTGMSIEEQKRALKNHREAQKKAIKRGYVIP